MNAHPSPSPKTTTHLHTHSYITLEDYTAVITLISGLEDCTQLHMIRIIAEDVYHCSRAWQPHTGYIKCIVVTCTVSVYRHAHTHTHARTHTHLYTQMHVVRMSDMKFIHSRDIILPARGAGGNRYPPPLTPQK